MIHAVGDCGPRKPYLISRVRCRASPLGRGEAERAALEAEQLELELQKLRMEAPETANTAATDAAAAANDDDDGDDDDRI